MSLFAKTGIRQSRADDQSQYVIVQTALRRIKQFPRTTQNVNWVEGVQENADYILYGETGDFFKINDIIEFNLEDMLQNLPFREGENVIKLLVKEPPKLYDTKTVRGYTQEIFLKSYT